MSENGQPAVNSKLIDFLLAQDRERGIAIASAILGDRHEAEDTVQETIAKIVAAGLRR